MTAIQLYRLANRLHKRRVPVLPWVLEKVILFAFRCVVPLKCDIGEGTELGYGGIAVVIHERARIGKNVIISPCVTIGGRSQIFDVPVIEDEVFIGAGAKILGPVTIGKGATIGANAVVLESVPPGSVAVGVPARVVRSAESLSGPSASHARGI